MRSLESLTGQARRDADAIAQQLAAFRRVGIAFSGGVDSAVLLAVAVAVLGRENAPAIFAVSPIVASREQVLSTKTAEEIGAELIIVKTQELLDDNFTSNPVDRCFYCRDHFFSLVDEQQMNKLCLDAFAFGENADDQLRPDRPGAKAATKHHVLRPLAQAGLTKLRVRQLARELGLSVADKPATPCLASRIPHGQPVTLEKLHQIELVEAGLADAGFTQYRMRHHGDIARIEVAQDEISLFASEDLRNGIVELAKKAGFKYVTVDLVGIQSGGLTMLELGRANG